MIVDNFRNGTIIKAIAGFYYVSCGGEVIECHARGRFRKASLSPIVGDKVKIKLNDDKTGSIAQIYNRKNYLVRPGVSNIDSVILVSAAKNPMPDLFLTDKLLITAESKGIESYICLNKTDLADETDIKEFSDIYTKAGYRVITACAVAGEGIDEIKSIIKGKTVAFAGLSGVGKSSLISKITGSDLKTGSVSRKMNGRHTTRHVELMSAAGGYVFDTPGFSRLETDNLRAEDLWQYFPEIRPLHTSCRFRTCNHIGEPDCAVKMGVMSNIISQSRYDNYVAIYNKLKAIKEWERKDTND